MQNNRHADFKAQYLSTYLFVLQKSKRKIILSSRYIKSSQDEITGYKIVKTYLLLCSCVKNTKHSTNGKGSSASITSRGLVWLVVGLQLSENSLTVNAINYMELDIRVGSRLGIRPHILHYFASGWLLSTVFFIFLGR